MIDPTREPISGNVLELVPESVAKRLCVLPVHDSDEALHLLLPDASASELAAIVNEAAFILNRPITFDVLDKEQLRRAIEYQYDVVIEGCNWKFQFQCPKFWAALELTADKTVRFCAECSKEVHLCFTDDEIREHAERGDCIANGMEQAMTLGLIELPETLDHKKLAK